MAPAYRLKHRAAAEQRARTTARHPANELYDSACELLDAARHLRRAAAPPGSWPAIAASLGSVEAALAELGDAAADMGLHASTRAGGAQATAVRDLCERLRLRLALAQSLAGAAREGAGPLVAGDPSEAV